MLNRHEKQCTKFVESQQEKHKNNMTDFALLPSLSISEVWVFRA